MAITSKPKIIIILMINLLLFFILGEIGLSLFFTNPLMELNSSQQKSNLNTDIFNARYNSTEQSPLSHYDPCQDDVPLTKVYGHFMALHPYFGYVLNPLRECARGKINKHGFYASEFVEKEETKIHQLYIAGGSTSAFCEGHESKGSWLQYVFNKETNRKVQVYNVGMPGHRLPHIHAIGTQLTPYMDSFVINLGYNELMNHYWKVALESPSRFFNMMNLYGHGNYWSFLKYNALVSIKYLYMRSVLKHSHLASGLVYLLIKSFDAKALYKEAKEDNYLNLAYTKENREKTIDFIQSMERYLVSLKALTHHYKINLIITIQPLLHFKNYRVGSEKDYHHKKEEIGLAKEFVEEFVKKLDELNIPYIDNSRLFAAYKNQIFRDDVHFFENKEEQENGCYLMAKEITTKLNEVFNY